MVSVVIPLYNKAPCICRALSSVLRQTVQDFECIVVDDGSTDGGGDIVEGMRDQRIRLVRQPNGGVSRARTRGIELARHPLIAFLDADDEWMPDFLREGVRMYQENPQIVAYFTNYKRTGLSRPTFCDDSRGPRVLSDYFAFCLSNAGLGMCSSAVMVRRDALVKAGGFPVGRKMGEDLDTWTRLAWTGPIGYYPQVLVTYHFGSGACAQSGINANQETHKVSCAILETYLTWLRAGRVPAALAESTAAYICLMRLLDVYEAIRRGQPDLARLLHAGLPRWQRVSAMGLCGYFALSMPGFRRPLLGLGRRLGMWVLARRWREEQWSDTARSHHGRRCFPPTLTSRQCRVAVSS